MNLELFVIAEAEWVGLRQQLRARRKARHVTQQRLAEVLGVSTNSVLSRELGRKGMGALEFIAHAAALGYRVVLEEDTDDDPA